jgi:sortase A
MHTDSFLTLRRFNNGLTLIIVLFALYLILLPFLPVATWWVSHSAPLISRPATVNIPAASAPSAPTENTLYIPSLGMSAAVHEGSSAKTLRQGVWHIPNTSSPDEGGNTVFAGHRSTFSGPGVFFHLDKVKVGDPISLLWDGQRYDYVVTKTLVVPPTRGDIQAPTKQDLLTIYTCTPFWSFTDRLVVQAEPVTEAN